MLNLSFQQLFFVGFKADNSLRRRLEVLNESDRRFVATDDSAILRICRVGADTYVGKLVRDCLMTDQVEDIRRDVLSTIRKLGTLHLVRLPGHLKIVPCSEMAPDSLLTAALPASP